MTALDGLSVCIAAMHYKPETTGNAPYTTAMAHALQEAGARVHVVTGIPHYPQWKIGNPKYLNGSYWLENDHNIQLTRCRHWVPAVPDLVGRARMEWTFLRRAQSVIRRDASSILICVTPMLSSLAAGLLARHARPVGAFVQDLTGNAAGESGTTGGAASRVIGSAEYALLRRCSLTGVITPTFGDIIQQHGVNRGKIIDLPNFTHITPSLVDKRAARAELGWPQDKLLVVHSGNIGKKQGLDSVVDAARLVDRAGLNIQFVLVGDGNQRNKLQNFAEGAGSIRFVEPVDDSTYPLVLSAADILLVHERAGVKEMSLPSKITSYAAARRPILAAVEPGSISFNTLRRADAAQFAEPNNPRALVESVLSLGADPQRASALANSAYDLYQAKYSRKSAYQRYVDFASQLAVGELSITGRQD